MVEPESILDAEEVSGLMVPSWDRAPNREDVREGVLLWIVDSEDCSSSCQSSLVAEGVVCTLEPLPSLAGPGAEVGPT